MASGTKQGQESRSSTSLTALVTFTNSFTLPGFPREFRRAYRSFSRFSRVNRWNRSVSRKRVPFRRLLLTRPFRVNWDRRFVRDRWWRCAHRTKVPRTVHRGGEIIRKFGLVERCPKMRSTRVGNLSMDLWMGVCEREHSSLMRFLIRFLLSNFGVLVSRV